MWTEYKKTCFQYETPYWVLEKVELGASYGYWEQGMKIPLGVGGYTLGCFILKTCFSIFSPHALKYPHGYV